MTTLTRGDLQVMIASVLSLLVVVWAANGSFSTIMFMITMYGYYWSRWGREPVGSCSTGHRVVAGSLLALLSLNIVTNGRLLQSQSGGASQQLLTRGVAAKFQRTLRRGTTVYQPAIRVQP